LGDGAAAPLSWLCGNGGPPLRILDLGGNSLETLAPLGDTLAAATLMAMNNVYYRFRHLSGKASYAAKPARLRMTRLAKPATTKADFELICLAVSAVNACETCIQAHERVVLEGGLTEEHVHDAVRIAATVHAAAVSLTFPKAAGAQLPPAAIA
jgi:alkyl hydroperoxide reductase subunit D